MVQSTLSDLNSVPSEIPTKPYTTDHTEEVSPSDGPVADFEFSQPRSFPTLGAEVVEATEIEVQGSNGAWCKTAKDFDPEALFSADPDPFHDDWSSW
jgi:hypothetical protein